jgi:hypothetical protein
MSKPLRIGITFLLLSAGAVGGCGGSSDVPTKAAFIKQADAICARADSKQKADFRKFAEEHTITKLTSDQQSKLIVSIGLPPIITEASELRELTPPDGDEDEVQAIIDGMENGVKAAEKEPLSMNPGPNNPFNSVDQMARKYGFKGCSDSS